MIKFYEAPSVEVMDVAVEQGFAASDNGLFSFETIEGTTNGWDAISKDPWLENN